MADHVYRRFTQDDLFETRVHAQPQIVVESGTAGYYGYLGEQLIPSASLSLYGGVRARADVSSGSDSGIELYPLDLVDTHSIDKVVGIPGQYPQTGSISVVTVQNIEDPNFSSDLNDAGELFVTGNQWYEEHFRPISLLYQWYHDHLRTTYQASATLPSTIQVVHVPAMFYGRQIVTGSVLIYDNSYNALVSRSLYYVDDGYGNLIVSGTDIRSKVGNVFYNEGLIVFTAAPVLTGTVSGSVLATPFTQQYWDSGSAGVAYHIEFKGSNVIDSKVFMCRMGPGDVNASNNPTYWTRDGNGRMVPRYPGNTTYVTAIGIYNEERQLVAVAKLAQPIRKREKDRIDIRLKMDF